MSVFVKNDKILRALRICGILTSVWPLEDGAGRFKVISYKVLLWVYLVNDFSMVPTLIWNMSHHRNDFANVMKAIMELMYVSEEIVNILYCMVREKRFRKLLAELECADDERSPYEEILRREFMFYARVVYTCAVIIYFVCAITFALSPLVLSQRRQIPLNTIYPLSMSEMWAWCLVYTLNVFSIIQAFSVLQIDLMIITILWNATFKFSLVGIQMHSVFTVAKLRAAIDAHQKVFAYTQEMEYVIGFLIMKSVVVVFVNSINCSLLVINTTSGLDILVFLQPLIILCNDLVYFGTIVNNLAETSSRFLAQNLGHPPP
ncbi:uncharacterized protein LOC105190677 [Harpegnathos saltator]|uniref:uncharacterized protein LOC105190677 n=1 Tax=Harpegnathos saltator TaxID=610380 RepID=UPI000DBED858|nr:uncharacterized protein LOC105190677 [Harpegnathos saltator]